MDLSSYSYWMQQIRCVPYPNLNNIASNVTHNEINIHYFFDWFISAQTSLIQLFDTSLEFILSYFAYFIHIISFVISEMSTMQTVIILDEISSWYPNCPFLSSRESKLIGYNSANVPSIQLDSADLSSIWYFSYLSLLISHAPMLSMRESKMCPKAPAFCGLTLLRRPNFKLVGNSYFQLVLYLCTHSITYEEYKHE